MLRGTTLVFAFTDKRQTLGNLLTVIDRCRLLYFSAAPLPSELQPEFAECAFSRRHILSDGNLRLTLLFSAFGL